MTLEIPFLKPKLPPIEDYIDAIRGIDARRYYSNSGPLCREFEGRVLAEAFGGEGGFCTVANATLGLMLAIQQVRRAGRYAVMPSFTFAAAPLAAQWCGLEPWFVDVDPEAWWMDPGALDATVRRLGDQAAVLVPYATFGNCVDLEPLARYHASGLPVVVDAASSFGAAFEGRPFGQGFPGPVVFSFHATKAFSIGEGGGVYASDPRVAAGIREAANFGFGADRASECLGLNAKLTEYGSAIALSVWGTFPGRVAARRAIRAAYCARLDASGLSSRGWRTQAVRGEPAFQFFPLLAPEGVDGPACVAWMASRGIECRTYFNPACHVQPQFQACGRGPLPVTEALSSRILSLPLWEEMEDAHVDRVVSELLRFDAGRR